MPDSERRGDSEVKERLTQVEVTLKFHGPMIERAVALGESTNLKVDQLLLSAAEKKGESRGAGWVTKIIYAVLTLAAGYYGGSAAGIKPPH